MKNKRQLKYLPLIIIAVMFIATASVGENTKKIMSKLSNTFAETMSIFENYGKDRTKFITNAKGRAFGTETEIKDPFNTYIIETQAIKITAHPNGVAEIIDKELSPNKDVTMIEIPEYMSIDEYINNNP